MVTNLCVIFQNYRPNLIFNLSPRLCMVGPHWLLRHLPKFPPSVPQALVSYIFFHTTNNNTLLVVWKKIMFKTSARASSVQIHQDFGNAKNYQKLSFINLIQPCYSVENYLINFFGRGFPRGVGFFKMELPTFQCYTYTVCSEFTFFKTVNFRDLFDILK